MTTGSKRKAAEKAELKNERIIWFGIAATESNLQRLGALIMFADQVETKPPKCLGKLPWEDPADPRYVPENVPAPELNYELIRKDIVKVLMQYAELGRIDEGKAIVREYGEKVSQLHVDKLLPLYHDLTDRLNPKDSE